MSEHATREPPDTSALSEVQVTAIDPLKSYSITNAAQLIDVSPRHLYDLIARGEIAAYDIGTDGGKKRILATEIARFQRARQSKTRRPSP